MHRIPLAAVQSAITYANTFALMTRGTGSVPCGMESWVKKCSRSRFALSLN